MNKYSLLLKWNRFKQLFKINKNSLFYKLLSKISLLFLSFFLIIGVSLTYVLGKQSLEDFKKLRQQENTLRSQSQSLKFSKTVQDLNEIKYLISKSLSEDSFSQLEINEFDKEMSLYEDNSYRSKDINNKAVGFISSKSEIGLDFKNTFNKVFKILNTTGATAKNEYYMVWAVFPNDSNIAYCKENPEVNLKIPHDFSDTSQDYWIQSTLEKNPNMDGKWLKPYYDKSFDKWMISYVTPIVLNNNHILTIGIDISLKDLFQTLELTNEGKSYILSASGEIIAHPDYMTDVINTNGKFNISAVENFNFTDFLKADGFYQKNDKDFYISSITQTDWKYVSSYSSFKMSSLYPVILFWMIVIGFLGLVLFGTLYYTIRKYLINPIDEMSKNLSIDIVSMNPMKFKQEVTTEVNLIYNLYKKFILIVKEKEENIESTKRNFPIEVDRAVENKVAIMRSKLLSSIMEKLDFEVFKKNTNIKLLSERIFSKFSEDKKTELKPIQNDIYNNFLDVKLYADKLRILSVDGSKHVHTMQYLEDMTGQVEEIYARKLKLLNITLDKKFDSFYRFKVNEQLFLQSLIGIMDNCIDSLEKQKDGERKITWEMLQTTDSFYEFRISDTSSSLTLQESYKVFGDGYSTKENRYGGGLTPCNLFKNVHDNIAISTWFDKEKFLGFRFEIYSADSTLFSVKKKVSEAA